MRFPPSKRQAHPCVYMHASTTTSAATSCQLLSSSVINSCWCLGACSPAGISWQTRRVIGSWTTATTIDAYLGTPMYLRYVGNLPTCDVFSRLHHTHLLALLVWFGFCPVADCTEHVCSVPITSPGNFDMKFACSVVYVYQVLPTHFADLRSHWTMADLATSSKARDAGTGKGRRSRG